MNSNMSWLYQNELTSHTENCMETLEGLILFFWEDRREI